MKLERRNAYFCSHCRKTTITVDVDSGVTPMFILCPYCSATASSFMYQLPGCMHINIKADYEWYHPIGLDYDKLSVGEKDHVDKGGLIMRKRTKSTPIYIDYGNK
jgi:hypothetical protein